MAIGTNNADGKIAELCQALRGHILAGRYKPGAALPSPRILSQEYGVAEATAGAAVGHLAREGFAVRIRGRGSFVSEQLPVQHTVLDFLRIRDLLGNENSERQLKWIEEFSITSKQQGWTPQWHHVSVKETENAERLAGQLTGSNGLISWGWLPAELLVELRRNGVRHVAVFLRRGGMKEGPAFYGQISYDRRESAKRATEHLISLGHTRIGFIGLRTSPLRTIGFLDAISEAGLPNQAQWLINLEENIHLLGGPMHERCRELCQDALKRDDRPQAFCCSTQVTAQCLAGLAVEMGLRVPQDLAIIACDESFPDPSADFNITTVGVSRPEACQKALEVLKQQEPDELRLFDPIMMPLHLTIGDSCGAKLKAAAGQIEKCKEKCA